MFPKWCLFEGRQLGVSLCSSGSWHPFKNLASSKQISVTYVWGIKKHYSPRDTQVLTTQFKYILFMLFLCPHISLSSWKSPLPRTWVIIALLCFIVFLICTCSLTICFVLCVFKLYMRTYNICVLQLALFFNMLLTSIHIVACVVFLNMPQGEYILFPIDRFLSCLKYFVIANSIDINFLIQVFWYMCARDSSLWMMNDIDKWFASSVVLEGQIVFQSDCAIYTFTRIISPTLDIVRLFNFCQAV